MPLLTSPRGTPQRLTICALLAIAFGAAFAAGYALSLFSTDAATADHTAPLPEHAEVRIAARATGDGRVEVALQERGLFGEWSGPHLPQQRYLSTDAEAGKWRLSSSIPVSTHWPGVGVGRLETESLYGATLLEQFGLVPEPGLLCLVGHGDPALDSFWEFLATAAYNSAYLSRAKLRTFYSLDGAAQAHAIRECIADGAWGIAATLANADAVGDALRDASAAGINILTYNSGAERSASVNAFAHVGLDDKLGGERVGTQFNEAGVEGEIWCLIHEALNRGLEDRCDGLEQTYSGAVTRVRIHTEALRAEAAMQLPASGVRAVVGLNTDTLLWLVEVTAQAGIDDLTVAGFGNSPQLVAPLATGQLSFILWDQPSIQGVIAVNLLLTPPLWVSGNVLETGGAAILIEPAYFDWAEAKAYLTSITPGALADVLQRAGITAEQAALLGLGGGP
ncbi:MAG: substrate-binding domain-containing protein [Chloroflexota bacterium]|nr:substrate-binding domain-containing protein [Chloroflexota bacterium]